MSKRCDDWELLHERARARSTWFAVLSMCVLVFGLGVFSGGTMATGKVPLANAGVFGLSMFVSLGLFIASTVILERDTRRMRRHSEWLRERRAA